MYNFKDLGFVNMNGMLEQAYADHYAVPALNYVSIEQYNGIFDALIEKRSPAILIISPNLLSQYGDEMIARISQSGVDKMRNNGIEPQVALHLDHGMSFEHCKKAIAAGFSSVMIDGSAKPFEENIQITKKVVDYAHDFGISVEGELGVLAGAEESGPGELDLDGKYTDPAQVEEFVSKTGVDCLAISIGTCHGLIKMKPNPDGTLPELRHDILEVLAHRLPGFPIVLHGASTLMPEYVDMINNYGGRIESAVGIPESEVTKAAKSAVCKVNIASDGWILGLALTRKILAENAGAIDSRIFKLKIRSEMKRLYVHKIDILGSANRL